MQKTIVHERIRKYAVSSIEDLHQDFSLTDEGLLSEEVSSRRQRYGSNDSAGEQKKSIFHAFRRAFINPFSIILFLIGTVSFFTDVVFPRGYQKNPTTVIIIFLMLLLSGFVRLLQELKAKKIADGLTVMVDATVLSLRDGEWKEISTSDLVVGDRIRLSSGDRIPADLRIVASSDLFVSQSVITGESAILEKDEETLSVVPHALSDYTNILFTGTSVVGGTCEGVVLAVGKDTVYGDVRSVLHERKRGFDKGANAIAWVLIRFMLILVPVVFLASGITKGDWLEAILFALSVAVGLTPELLPMVVNASLARGSHLMEKKDTIVRNINAMQGFGSMDVLCLDKTGTLTGDRIVLEYYMDILGNESRKTLDYAYLAAYYNAGIQNPLDTSICRVRSLSGEERHYDELVQIHQKLEGEPFDYNRHFSTVVVTDGESSLEILKGSVEEVLKRCGRFEYRGEVAKMEEDASSSVHAVVDEMMEDGMKVIAVAYRQKGDADYILVGYLAFFDAPRESAAGAICRLKKQHVLLKVLSGDNALVASSICSRLGIESAKVITGTELENQKDGELSSLVEKYNVFAELTPSQKAVLVKALQANGHTVGFLGDGLNDLPAVLQADVGIATENGTEAVKDSSDVILRQNDLRVLEEGIIEGRKAFGNMSKYIRITASSNFGNILSIVFACVLLPFFPMTAVQLLLLNLLYDMLCLVLPWDNVDEEMLSAPLEWSGKRLGSFMAFFGPLSSIFDLITFAFLFLFFCPKVSGGSYWALDGEGQKYFVSLFQSGWFLESMWTQVLILQLLRTKKLPFVQSKPGMPVVVVSLVGIVLFTLLPLTPLGTAFGLVALPGIYYLFLIVVVALYLLLVTVMKSIYIRKRKTLL